MAPEHLDHPAQPDHPARVVARLARQVEVSVASVELTLSQYRVLGILGDGREAASVLADKLAVSRPSITGVVDGLCTRGLVARTHDVGDRRRIGLDLTEEGRRVLTAADAQSEARLHAIAEHLGAAPAETEAFGGLVSWREALDRHRAAAVAARRAASPDCARSSAPVGVMP